MCRFKFCDPVIEPPKFNVVAVDKLLGLFFGRLIVRTNDIDAILDMSVRIYDVGTVLLHLPIPATEKIQS
jgi:hypothetical protein